jgi:23S rRNA pseudouridine1911/1915/1917 synthase
MKTTVGADEAGRVDRVVQRLTKLSRKQVQGLFDHSCVTVNGLPTPDSFARVEVGDDILVDLDPHRRYAPKARPWKDSTFRIVFEDEHLLVIDKSAAALTVPSSDGQANTLIQRVGEYLTARGGKQKRAWVCHRLDRGVSGLLVVGKSEHIATQIRNQFESRKPDRRYVAIVRGRVARPTGTFRSYLATGDDLSRYSTSDTEKGELAITHYQVLDHVMEDATLVSVRLETGRRNQIRVHFAEAGHPVLGDPRYKSRLARHTRWRVNRLALHAAELGFMHPVTGEALRFESPLPPPMEKFLAGLTAGKLPGKSARPRTPFTKPADKGKPRRDPEADRSGPPRGRSGPKPK